MKSKKLIGFVLSELLLGITIIFPVLGMNIIVKSLEIDRPSILNLFFQDHIPCRGAFLLDILFILLVAALMIFLLVKFIKTKDDYYTASARHWFYIAAIVGVLLFYKSQFDAYVYKDMALQSENEMDITVVAEADMPYAVNIFFDNDSNLIGRLEPGKLDLTGNVREISFYGD